MNILSIETSCDETAVSIVKADGDFPNATYSILGNALYSQIEIHKEYGGVFPTLAKREHAKSLTPLLESALREAGLFHESRTALPEEEQQHLQELLYREEGMADALIAFFELCEKPAIDAIAVTNGPGLEPALWVGVNFAKALSRVWSVPVVPTNHMEGHILSSVFDGEHLSDIQFPALALLISGGHTELVKMNNWQSYELVGATRDDAVGEAFDKVARLLDIEYPGGPVIDKLALDARERDVPTFITLPRPMLDSGDFDFSFSGLKTAVRYAVENKTLTEDQKVALARDFVDAVVEVLTKKTLTAYQSIGACTLILGGGVSASKNIRNAFSALFEQMPEDSLYLPNPTLSTDNAVMIALAGHAKLSTQESPDSLTFTADGNLSLHN